MKISEIIAEDLQAGGGGAGVGNAGSETIMLKPPEPKRRIEQPPQVGYRIRIGRKSIPTPGYAADDAVGVVNSVVGG